ncbi:exported hypothetical protein [Mesorhizobium plurifarium]|uniref:Porin n=1 Tax=Mesorhizobium plurifarium TaxID=69974 RepID=A0A090DNY3_MESPL|nr:exported hypothetical protein [Mesorhizobium plurifarium]
MVVSGEGFLNPTSGGLPYAGIHRLVSFAFLAAASGFSLSALAAPVEYVRVCSAYGTNYYYSPGTDTCINANTGETRRLTEDGVVAGKTALASKVDDIDKRVQRAFEGASVASALTSPDLVEGEHFGVRVNWGNAGQSNASPARPFWARISCPAVTAGWRVPRASLSPARRSAAMPACS